MSPRPPSPHLPHTLSTHFLLIEADRSEEAALDHPPRPLAQVGRAGGCSLDKRNPCVFICTFLHISQHG